MVEGLYVRQVVALDQPKSVNQSTTCLTVHSMPSSNLIRSMYMMGRRRVQHATMSNATLLAGPLRTNVSSFCPLPSGLGSGCLLSSSSLSSSDKLDSENRKSSSSISESSSEPSLSEVFALECPGDISPISTALSSSAVGLDFDFFESANFESPSLGWPCVACLCGRGSGGGGDGNRLKCRAHRSLQMICTTVNLL